MLYRQLFELAPAALILVDAGGLIVATNARAAAIFGYERDELIGRPIEILVPAELREGHAAKRHRPEAELKHRANRNRPLVAVRKDGARFPADIGLERITHDGAVHVVAAVHDVSERVVIEDQLRQAQKMEAIGRLAGGLAHDFNNYLTAINGYAEVILEGLSPADPRRGDLEEIRRAGDRAGALTRQLLGLGRVEPLAPTVVDLREVVGDLEPILRRLIDGGVELAIDVAGEPCPVRVDPGQVDQVLINLVANANDALGGEGRVAVQAMASNGHVELVVTDSGVGMDQATIDRAFEPFFTTKPAGRGSGLGLATTYGIVRQLGGTIRVNSVLGEGTTFTISLPSADRRRPRPRKIAGGGPRR